jgi:hypothetical protein
MMWTNAMLSATPSVSFSHYVQTMTFSTVPLRIGSRILLAQRRMASSAAAKPVQRTPQGSPPFAAEETIEISTEKNGAMAATLFSFCVGVAWYSMNAVGQAGTAGSDDPLAALRQEAAAAQDKQDRQEKSTDEAAAMLKKFQAGDFDPDKVEDLEDEESKPKRSWWKVW